MSPGLLGILDIGKTHARFLTASAAEGIVSADHCDIPQALRAGVVWELDIGAVESWLIETIRRHPLKSQIHTLLPIAHGAAAVLVSAEQQVIIAPDYEDPRFDSVREAYRAARDPFNLTYSPLLPLGLNLGKQLFYLKQHAPLLLAGATQLLLYPQYWAWRLSGIAASELTSLGCHSDLWRPLRGHPSALSIEQGWSRLLPRLRSASEPLGVISAEIREQTGLSGDCQVLCGLHDSSASFLAHMASRQGRPFAVVSSGTWTIVMARGASLARVREELDMLVNVDVTGAPVATARFMGGREYEIIAGAEGVKAQPSREDLHGLISRAILALPSFSSAGGPFASLAGRILGAAHLTARERAALATLYLALMTNHLLTALDAQGEIVIDGPLAQNVLFAEVLAQLRPHNLIQMTRNDAPTAAMAAAFLTQRPQAASAYTQVLVTVPIPGLEEYRMTWLSCLASAANA